jgi:hypothetical protein
LVNTGRIYWFRSRRDPEAVMRKRDALQQRPREEGTPSFLKKRSKRLLSFRNLPLIGHGRDLAAGGAAKVFLALFFRKERLA